MITSFCITYIGVGKTCLMLRYTNDVFNSSYISTIGVDFHIKSVDINGKKIRVQVSNEF